jgi:hypothetical protein
MWSCINVVASYSDRKWGLDINSGGDAQVIEVMCDSIRSRIVLGITSARGFARFTLFTATRPPQRRI